jgi:hypothetical protein
MVRTGEVVPWPEKAPVPSVTRMVHYVSHGSPDGTYPMACRAAVITETGPHPDTDMTVGLCVLNPTGMFFNRDVPCDPGSPVAQIRYPDNQLPLCDDRFHAPGSWHWPART